MSDFAPGDLVICVDASPSDADPSYAPLRLLQIYTIQQVHRCGEVDPRDGLNWEDDGFEIVGVPAFGLFTGWRATRFRKAVTDFDAFMDKVMEPVEIPAEAPAGVEIVAREIARRVSR